MKITDKFVFFWGKQDIYSNFCYTPFVHQGQLFKWAEQAIMYRKAKLFGADKIALEIIIAQTPKRCKELGRSRMIPFDEKIWNEKKMSIFEDVLFDKFSNPKLKKELLSTGNKHLAEASPYDKIWGIGMSEDNLYAEQPEKWRGQNLLGICLMNVRKKLK